MDYTVKPLVQEDNEQFELLVTDKATGVDGKEVSILKSVGTYRVADLEAQKAELNKQIAEIDEKISAITK